MIANTFLRMRKICVAGTLVSPKTISPDIFCDIKQIFHNHIFCLSHILLFTVLIKGIQLLFQLQQKYFLHQYSIHILLGQIMKAMLSILLLATLQMLCLCDYSTPPKNLKYTISPNNLVINPLIADPDIGSRYNKVVDEIVGWKTKNKFIEVIGGCLLNLMCKTNYDQCGVQYFDLDSYQANEQIYQRFQLTAGRDFQIKFDYKTQIPENIRSGGASIVWNNATIDSFYDNSCITKTKTYYVTSIDQTNQLVFQGLGLVDSVGIIIRNIFVRELIYEPTLILPSILPAVPYFEYVAPKDYSRPSKRNYFQLKNNLIQNPQIHLPIIAPDTFRIFRASVNGWSTRGLYVEYIDGAQVRYCNGQNFAGWQFIDTDSINNNEKYYQSFTLAKGKQFELKFDWVPQSPYNSQSTAFSVLWNNVTIATFYDNGCLLRTSTFYLQSVQGINEVGFQGRGSADSQGILLRNILLREINYLKGIHFEDLKTQSGNQQLIFKVFEYLNSPFLSVANSISAKSILTWVLGYVLEFNHFILYDYHRLNHTLTADVILAGMRALDDQRGYLIDQYVYPFLNTDPQSILQDFAQQSNLTVRMQSLYPTYTLRPNGFLLEITDGFFVSFAATLLLFGLGALLFRLLSRSRLSLIVRECSLMGLFWVLCLDGRVEVLTFHFLSNALRLPSANFAHKLKTAALVHAYFAVFLFAVAAMLVLRSVYGGLSKHFNNCKRQSLCATLYASFAFGVYNVVLGALHRLLIDRPRTQLCSLLTFEAASLTLMTALLTKKFFRNTFLAAALWLMTSARLCFFASFLVFELRSDWGECISAVQQYAFAVFVGLWGLSAVICLLFRVGLAYRTVRKWCGERKSNKVTPIYQSSNHKGQLALKRSQFLQPRSKSEITSLKQFMRSSTLIKENSSKKSINIFKGELRQQKRLKRNRRKDRVDLN